MAKKEKAPKEEKVKEPKAPKAGKEPKESKDKKAKKGKKGDATGTPSTPGSAGSTPLANIPPDQMTAAQIEQSIKESSDPETHLKRLRNPINVRSCLLNVLILVVLTIAIVILWCYIKVDKFNFATVVKDMSWQYGITQGFQWLWAQISGWFS